MFLIQRTDSGSNHFRELVLLLDAFLADRDGEDHAFYAQFNKLDSIKNAVVCYDNHEPVGCGAFKQYDERTVEIKRSAEQANMRCSWLLSCSNYIEISFLP